MFITLGPPSKNVIRMANGSRWISTSISDGDTGSTVCHVDSFPHKAGSARREGNGITSRVDKLLAVVKKQFESFSGSKSASNSFLAAGLFSLTAAVHRRPMQLEDAESLVKQWQTIKAEALGSDHQVQFLPEILGESMLVLWQALADKADARSCYWRFVLLQLSVLRAEILSDGGRAWRWLKLMFCWRKLLSLWMNLIQSTQITAEILSRECRNACCICSFI
ncbi:plastid division protein CDP1, chloroplastic-like [Syzygium oleosum]|uniref:plastid division protein CDP1, chloroplastic-like n=1 Tax=Syzygium oleosum TaxID=219896 RepID=UPI0011D1B670|nr:plastid division protein CDP1, chloroplastic-like [Syzygium oleosum]